MREIESDPDLELQVLVTGMHLSPTFGYTVSEIEADGMPIAARVDIGSMSGSHTDVVSAVGAAVTGIGTALTEISPDTVVLLGDRYEIFAAAQAAMFLNLHIVHIGGGDNGHGTHDNYMRHCISKMAHLHFVTHDAAKRRVIQLGENPSTVLNTGSLAVDAVLHTAVLSIEETQERTGIDFGEPTLLVAYHPVSLDLDTTIEELEGLTTYLRSARAEGFGIVLTGTNADAGNDYVRQEIMKLLAEAHPSTWFFENLGAELFHNVLRHSSALIGNSSSALYEAPLVQTPSVDIGIRQYGRTAGPSVIRTVADPASIAAAVRTAVTGGVGFDTYPYGDGPAAPRMTKLLRDTYFADIRGKTFYDLKIEDFGNR